MKRQNLLVWLIGLLLVTFAAGCHKKAPVAAAPPPPPPPPPAVEAPKPAPVITEFAIEPRQIDRGQSALLKWQVNNATSVQINQGIGSVAASGQQRISPTDSTTYTLVATGAGGNAKAEATLNVTLPPPPVPPPAPSVPISISQRLANEVQDALFDYDQSSLRSDAQAALTADAAALKSILSDFPNSKIVLEGHCDERGSAEYNLGLGDRRSVSAFDFLTQLGVPENRLTKISYGKERPQCTESSETCWQKNRRVHFSAAESGNLSVTGQ